MGAIISPCGQYRYQLDRGEYVRSRRWLLWIMLNPSTADAEQDDPTIRRCRGYAERWGFPGFDVANLYAWRAVQPAALKAAVDPVGPENDAHLLRLAARADVILLAWGAHGGLARKRGSDVLSLLWGYQNRFHVLGWTQDGEPNHPLMMRKDWEAIPWRSMISRQLRA